MKVNLLLVYRKHKKDIYDAIEDILFDFPILKDSNIIIHMRSLDKRLKRSFASNRNCYEKCQIKQEIKLNPKAFLFPNIDNKFKTVTNANYESVKDVIWHELGHSLQIYILCDYYKMDLNDYDKQPMIFADKLENEETNTICYKQHIDYHISKFNWHYDKARHLLGSYSIDDSVEFIPECFNNYYRLKNKSILDKYEQETFEFVKTVVEDYKKYVPDKV